MKAQLILENGKRFSGKMFGAINDIAGEVIFTTGMTGYQEIITDPSYAGQIVTMTFPLIGNYGINFEDMESDGVYLKALVVREKCDYPSNFRSEMTLDDFMKQQGVVGIEGIDTRALTKTIRENGTMKAVIVRGDPDDDTVNKLFQSIDNKDVTKTTTINKKTEINEKGNKHIAFIDMGLKDSVLKYLDDKNYKVTVFPAFTEVQEIIETNPDMVFVSNGPGNPVDAVKTIETVKELIKKYPVTGISMGHQIIALALGGTVEKLKYGHHGANQPVKNINSNRVFVTAQNHNYFVKELPDDVDVTYINVNDGTCEGLAHKTLPVMSLQFNPESAPKPLGLDELFDRFLKEVR